MAVHKLARFHDGSLPLGPTAVHLRTSEPSRRFEPFHRLECIYPGIHGSELRCGGRRCEAWNRRLAALHEHQRLRHHRLRHGAGALPGRTEVQSTRDTNAAFHAFDVCAQDVCAMYVFDVCAMYVRCMSGYMRSLNNDDGDMKHDDDIVWVITLYGSTL